MKRVILFVLIISTIITNAQNRNSVWIFGDSAGIDFSSLANPIPIPSGMDGRGSCVSISDSNGSLLFYSFTNATTDWSTLVMSKQHILMPNGDSITGVAWYNELRIIPFSTDSFKYYLFSCGSDVPNNEGLYYSIVDMSLNNGYGTVTVKDIQLNPNRIADCITSVKHGNGRDWWVICKLSDASPSYHNRFFKYLIDRDSIIGYSYQDFNGARDADVQKIIWNKSGDKFMNINIGGYMSEFSFDRCSGNISLIRNIFPQQTSNYSRLFWEGAYSPNGDVFYVSTDDFIGVPLMHLLQLDLTAPNIPASIDTLDSYQGYTGTGAVRLAPDSKIYFSRACQCSATPYCFPYPDSVYNNINMNLSVINSPDSLGSACNYQPFSFYLGGKRTYYGLPNNPNYELGPLVGSFCDTLTVGISNNEQGILNIELDVNYNPGLQSAFIQAKKLKGRKAEMLLYDITGKIIFQASKSVYNGICTYDLNMQQCAKGLYIVRLQTEKELLVKKFVKY